MSETHYADPYKRCRVCHGWVDGAVESAGPLTVIPCLHRAGYDDVCPSWSPVTGCSCDLQNHMHGRTLFREGHVI